MSPRRSPRAVVVAVAVAVVIVGVDGCGLPRTSDVRQGNDMGPAPLPPVRVQFEAPARGASAEAVVRGFLAAGWAGQDDYRTARAYLTGEASRTWDPRSSVTVYESGSNLAVTSETEGRVRLVADETARLDADGRYAARPAGTKRSATVELTRTGGEWRISRLDPGFGIWLSRPYFESAYRPFDVTYTAAVGTSLVPDRRWFAVGSGLPTTLARALLGPVPAYLEGAVTTGFPSGTHLAVDAVPVVSGTAEVDVSPSLLEASPDRRRRAWAQMLETLAQVSDVQRTVLRVGESELDIDGTRVAPSSASALGFETQEPAPTKIVRRRGSDVQAVDVRGFTEPDTDASPPIERSIAQVGDGWEHLAASADLREVAAVGGDGLDLRRWRGGRTGAPARFGHRLTAPAYDSSGFLWVGGLDASEAGRLWTLDTRTTDLGAAPRAVSAPWLAGRTVVAARPSTDGRRLVVVTRAAGGGTEIGVSGIVRDTAERPVRLDAPWRVGGDVVDALDVTWVDRRTLAVVGRRSAGATVRPLLVHLGGATTELAAVADPRRILTTGGERGLVVSSGNGDAYGRVGGAWQRFGTFDSLAVPGG